MIVSLRSDQWQTHTHTHTHTCVHMFKYTQSGRLVEFSGWGSFLHSLQHFTHFRLQKITERFPNRMQAMLMTTCFKGRSLHFEEAPDLQRGHCMPTPEVPGTTQRSRLILPLTISFLITAMPTISSAASATNACRGVPSWKNKYAFGDPYTNITPHTFASRPQWLLPLIAKWQWQSQHLPGWSLNTMPSLWVPSIDTQPSEVSSAVASALCMSKQGLGGWATCPEILLPRKEPDSNPSPFSALRIWLL